MCMCKSSSCVRWTVAPKPATPGVCQPLGIAVEHGVSLPQKGFRLHEGCDVVVWWEVGRRLPVKEEGGDMCDKVDRNGSKSHMPVRLVVVLDV